MKNIFRIIKKNLKLLIRAKSSAIIVILAPLLIILLVGIAFDNANTYGLNIGVYSSEFNQNVESVLDKLSQNEFKITRYQDQDSCVSDIEHGNTHTCVIFPPNFDFNSNEQKKVTYYVDQSKINLVWMITDTISGSITDRSQEISKDLANIIINKLDSTKNSLNEQKPTVANVKAETNSVLLKAQEINNNLASIDLTFNSSSFPADNAQSILNNISSSVKSNIDSGKSYITSAKNTISSSSASDPDKEQAIEQLNNAVSQLNSARLQLENSSSNQSLSAALGYITQIKNEITNTQNRLTLASTAKVSSQSKLSEAETSLSSTLSSLNNIENMFNNLIAEIEGLKVTDPNAISSPIITEIKPVTAQKTYLNYLFPSLMILVVMFISILLGTTLVLMEKHSPAHFRNFISPTRKIVFIISTYLTNILLVFVQLVIIFGIAIYFFSAQILPSLPMVALILILSATLFSLLGMAVGYLFISEETATLASISLGSLFLFISSTIIPIESMPAYVRQIAYYNPFVIAERLLRETILFQPAIKTLANDFYLLLGYSLALFLFIWGSQKLISKHFLQRMAYHHHKKIREKTTGTKSEIKVAPALKVEIKEQQKPQAAVKNDSRKKNIPRTVIHHKNESPRPKTDMPKSKYSLSDEMERINSELSRLR